MKNWVADRLICPECLEHQVPLEMAIQEKHADDVIAGELRCPDCGGRFPIREGVAVLLPEKTRTILADNSGYNSPGMMSSYLWSHFCDMLNEPEATDAYRIWSAHFKQTGGEALDIGCAVGRLSFELSKTHHRTIGIDNSFKFIQRAREITAHKRLDFDLIVEGHLTEPRGCAFNGDWNLEGTEFIVADALALPFRKQSFTTVAAVNILEKVPEPLKHLEEINRVLQHDSAMFLFSDPFSWDETVSPPDRWLSGNGNHQYSARGIDTMRRLFDGEHGVFHPPLKVTGDGDVAWKIRKTANLWEHIRSQYLVGQRA